ncbi:MAG TPA: pilus assembly protein PilP [Myxococcota bacterium]|jgi:type IV pilus assembly protein PilP|nr:pilus assembly protein PilP [Myxococcota bacterium]
MKRFLLIPLVFGLLGLGMVACGDDGGGATEKTERKGRKGKKGTEVAEVEEEPSEEEEESGDIFIPIDDGVSYAYNPIGKRDPFRSFFKTAGPESISSPTALQRFEVDQYQLVGIVWGITNARAMVQDPSQVGHVIEVGTYIGKNWGKVTQINSDSVVITEEYQTIDGELVTNQIVMELPFDDVEQ